MPRPKRTKVASRVEPTRVAKPSKPLESATPVPRQREASKSAPAPVSEPPESFSDDSDGLVVKTTKQPDPRGRKPWLPKRQENVDITMTGAIPAGEEVRAIDRKSSGRRQLSHVAITPGRGSAPSSAQSKSTHSIRSNGKITSITTTHTSARQVVTQAEVAPSEEESSLMDPSLLTFGSLDSNSPAHGTRPPSAIKVGATPAHEISILALTNFKRRARQPSLLRMVHQTTDVEDNDADELDDFNPEDESTPVHVRTAGVTQEVSALSGSNVTSSGSRGKKRKISPPVDMEASVVQVPRSSPPFEPPSGADVADSQRSSSPSLPENIMQSREEVPETQEQPEPELMSETMAPPKSSSPLEDEIVESPVKPRQRRKRAQSKRQASEAESDEEGNHQRARPKARNKTKAQNISTAKLQALLPRRRTRVTDERDEYDIESSEPTEIDPDQDELQLPPPRRGANAKKVATPKANKRQPRKGKKSTMATNVVQKNTRTYGRHSSDKENENEDESVFVVPSSDGADDDDLTKTTPVVPKEKAAAIAKKFEDVDAWEMEFESVDVGGGSSSPWR